MIQNIHQYKFTIIIPTYNRKKYLLDTLEYIKGQKVQPDEIIVIDASEHSFQLNESERTHFDLLKYVEWKEYGNISKQRNHGISMAKGNYILFLDDDVTFDDDLIQNYIEAFIATDADGISGLVETAKYKFGSNPIRFKGILSDIGEDNLQPCNIIAPTRVICTASFAIKTSVLIAIGGFDENQRGSYDDVETGFRLVKEGYKIIHHPLPKVFHIQASASGARDSSHGNAWGVENKIYFLLKHKYNTRKYWLLFLLIFETIKPSRTWLKPHRLYLESKLRICAFKRSINLQTPSNCITEI